MAAVTDLVAFRASLPKTLVGELARLKPEMNINKMTLHRFRGILRSVFLVSKVFSIINLFSWIE
jgi:hypothetical protein